MRRRGVDIRDSPGFGANCVPLCGGMENDMIENIDNQNQPEENASADLGRPENAGEEKRGKMAENVKNSEIFASNAPVQCQGKKPKKPFHVSFGVLLICILLTGLLVFQVTFVALSFSHKRDLDKAYGLFSKLDKLIEVAGLYDEKYLHDVDSDLLDEILTRMYVLSTGDKYASYYTREEWLESIASSMGDSVGIGVYVVQSATGGVEVAHVMKNSPAQRAGLKKGDVITAIAGHRVSEVGYEAAVDYVRGESGSVVTLELIRDGVTMTIDVTRGSYEAETVISEVMVSYGKKVGYVRITEFMQVTVSQFKDAVNELIDMGVSGFVFDVRDNPGGDLNAICEILDFLLPEGPIVHVMHVDGEEEVHNSDKNEIDLPMVVLANGNTASAAELFTSALRDYDKAEVIGTLTYGKGCGQQGFSLSDGSVVFITNFFYNPPFSDNYDGIGILPDVQIEMPEHLKNKNLFLVNHDEDIQLLKALDILTSK